MLLDIVLLGHPALRKRAKEVAVISQEIRDLIANMIETVNYSPNRIGLAAPQVDADWRIFVIRPILNEGTSDLQYGPAEVYINPLLSNQSEETVLEQEGCLSLPEVYAPVPRPKSITVTAQDINGETFIKNLSGYYARQVMHENDHLNGVLFIDRVLNKDRKKLKKDVALLKKRIKEELL